MAIKTLSNSNKRNQNVGDQRLRNLELGIKDVKEEIAELEAASVVKHDNIDGKATLILSKDKTFASQLTQTNTIYVVRNDFDFDDDEVTIPAGCVLKFEGGSLTNGTITGQNTVLLAKDKPIFENIHIDGSWLVPDIYSYWFKDATSNNVLKELFNLSSESIYNNIYISEDVYNVSTPTENEKFCLQVKSNTRLEIDGTIQLAANDLTSYNVVQIDGKENVVVCGSGTIVGDKNIHTGSTGQWGHGIGISNGCRNIEVSGLTIKDCWGDCVAVDGNVVNENIKIHDFVLDNGRRQGISVIFANNVQILNGTITNISGIEPYAAIDVEPNSNGYCKNIHIINVKAISDRGFMIAQANSLQQSIDVENVYFHNCYVEAKEFVFDIRCGDNTQINNCILKQNNSETNYSIHLQTGSKGVTFDNCSIETNTIYCFYIGSTSNDAEIKNSTINCNKFAYFDKTTKICNNNIACTEIKLERAAHIFDGNTVSISGDFFSQVNGNITSHNNIVCTNASFINADAYNNKIQCNEFKTNGTVELFENEIYAAYILLRGTLACGNNFVNTSGSSYDGFVYIQNTVLKNNILNCSRTSGAKPIVYVVSQSEPSICSGNIFKDNALLDRVYYTNDDNNVFKDNKFSDTKSVILPTNANSGFVDNNIGTTRPTLAASKAGFCFFDKSLSPARPIWWNGTEWVDSAGATV